MLFAIFGDGGAGRAPFCEYEGAESRRAHAWTSHNAFRRFRRKKIKSKVGNTYVASRRAQISRHLANASVDYDAIFVYAGLQPIAMATASR